MNAKEAKELADKNKSARAEQLKVRALEAEQANVEVLLKHFRNCISRAVADGKASTEEAGIEIKFPEDRFSNEEISTVVNTLRKENFQIYKETHNAFKTIKFQISWV